MQFQITGTDQTVDITDNIFACEYNEALIHQVVTAYLAGGRSGNQAQKTRAEVRGGGIKPWKQKGTGRARAGTIRSPIWRKGGVVFAAKPRSYEQKVNKKMYRGALRSIFSELMRSQRLILVDQIQLDTPKTKNFIKKLNELNINNSVLIVTEGLDLNLYLASRNLQHVDVRDVTGIDPSILIKNEQVLITLAALKQVEELLK